MTNSTSKTTPSMRHEVACARMAQAVPGGLPARRRGGAHRRNNRRQHFDAPRAMPEPDGAALAKADQHMTVSEALNAGGQQRAAALASLRGSIVQMSFDKTGCRVVQDAVELADKRSAEELVAELHGYVLQACQCPHANYVLQKIIEVLPTAVGSRFILEEIQGQAPTIARHRYGCRILCRLLAYGGKEALLALVMDEILVEAKNLSCHYYGHHVLEHILEHGLESQKHYIAVAICGMMGKCAQDAHGSFLIEAAMRSCSWDDQRCFEQSFLREDLVSLACSRFGSHVVRAFLKLPKLPGGASQQTFSFLSEHSAQLTTSKFGRYVLEEMCMGIPERNSEVSG